MMLKAQVPPSERAEICLRVSCLATALAKGIDLYVSSGAVVSPKKPYTLKIDPELLAALRDIKERDGIAESEQIRRGIQMWLDSKGRTAQRAERKRAVTRKRS